MGALILGATVVATGVGMLGVMASGYLLMAGLASLAFLGVVMYFGRSLLSAYFDETVDPWHMMGFSHIDVAFIDKEIDLRLIENERRDPAKTTSYVAAQTEAPAPPEDILAAS